MKAGAVCRLVFRVPQRADQRGQVQHIQRVRRPSDSMPTDQKGQNKGIRATATIQSNKFSGPPTLRKSVNR